MGKSYLASQFPNALFIASEPTQRAIPGIYIQDVTTWGEFKKIVRYLKDDEVKKNFKTIVLDTIDLLSDFCEKYICNREGVEDISDIAWGKGYKMVENEFETTLRAIINEGYGCVYISHLKLATVKREDGTEYNEKIPAVSSARCRAVAENLADIYCTIETIKDDEGKPHRVLSLRPNDESTTGGNHFRYLNGYCDVSYDALSKAVSDAIDKEETENGNKGLVKDERNVLPQQPIYDFDSLLEEFNTMTRTIQKNTSKKDFNEKWFPYINGLIEKYLGKGKSPNNKNDCGPQQVEQLSLIVSDLKDKVGEGI